MGFREDQRRGVADERRQVLQRRGELDERRGALQRWELRLRSHEDQELNVFLDTDQLIVKMRSEYQTMDHPRLSLVHDQEVVPHQRTT